MNLSAETLFSLAGALVLPGWLLLIFAPAWRYTRPLISWGMVLPVSLLYVFLLLSSLGETPAGAGFDSLHAVSLLFSREEALLAGWVHYLAFDLFTGLWIATDARSRGIPRWLVAPALVLTFLVGPAGWLLYFLGKNLR